MKYIEERTLTEDIEERERTIASLQKYIASMEDAIKSGSKRTGKPLTANTVRSYHTQIAYMAAKIKHYAGDIQQIQESGATIEELGMGNDHVSAWITVARLKIRCDDYKEKIDKLEKELGQWEAWYQTQNRRAPLKPRSIPANWRVIAGGARR